MERDFEILIIGGGVVGLACAARLALQRHHVALVERHPNVALESSSRNSGVIHAGLYHPAHWLKNRLCRLGRVALYARCHRENLPHRVTGKLIVATNDGQTSALESLYHSACDHELPDLQMLDARACAAREPAVRAVAGLYSPYTGIVDASALARSLWHEASEHGASIVLQTEVVALEHDGSNWRVLTHQNGHYEEVRVGRVINAAGLAADRIAQLAGIDVDRQALRLYPCKGDYFALAPSAAAGLQGLVYPLPEHAGLGVHLTCDLAGRWFAGPDATYVQDLNYGVDSAKATTFAQAIQRYMPSVTAHDLAPAHAGIRAKLGGPGQPPRDFVIERGEVQGAKGPGLVNLIGIESPGLTASLAIADYVAALMA